MYGNRETSDLFCHVAKAADFLNIFGYQFPTGIWGICLPFLALGFNFWPFWLAKREVAGHYSIVSIEKSTKERRNLIRFDFFATPTAPVAVR